MEILVTKSLGHSFTMSLVDSYDRLMGFVRKHLPDKFHQEADQRVSLRDRIFREIVANMLVHREFTNAYPAKFIIKADRVLTENWNRPHSSGTIDPDHFSPYPKNPTIAKFFKELGRVEELGSGVRNTFKYLDVYAPAAEPQFIEDDVFKAIIPLKAKGEDETILKEGERLGERLGENEQKVLEFIAANVRITIPVLADKIDISTTAVENNIKKLKTKGLLKRIGSARGGHWKIIDENI